MASSIPLPRSYLIYGVCLPLAVLIGYILAQPMDSGSIALVSLVLAALSVPVFLRWHHPMLIFSWNSVCSLVLLPISLCMALTLISIFVSILNRAIGRRVSFFEAPGVAKSLICLGVVVVITAGMNGGIGFAALGSNMVGGKRYFSVCAGILCYFALACQRISLGKAPFYIGLFWLSALTMLLGYLGALAGPPFDFLVKLFPVESELMGDRAYGTDVLAPQEGLFRLGSIGMMGTALAYYLLSRHGIRGVINVQRPWRLLFFGLALVGVVAGGFRSSLVCVLLTFGCMFFWEGLFQIRYLMMLSFAIIVIACAILPFTSKLPMAMQRTLSMLPVEVDPMVRNSADASTEWRLLMWKELLPQIPKYLFKGKGYAIDPHEFYQADLARWSGTGVTAEGAIIAGDYHSGPLSVIIPFGIYGVAAFTWFLCAAVRVLYRNYLYGDPALKNFNTFLLAFFLVQIFSYIFIFGSFYSGLIVFCGSVGFSVSLNGVATEPDLVPESFPVEEEF